MEPGGSADLVQRALDVIDGRWKLLIIFRLFETPVLRFSELQRALSGVSHKMLTAHLRALENDGVVQRSVSADIPPHVDYRLTERGRKLGPVLRGMRDWMRDAES